MKNNRFLSPSDRFILTAHRNSMRQKTQRNKFEVFSKKFDLFSFFIDFISKFFIDLASSIIIVFGNTFSTFKRRKSFGFSSKTSFAIGNFFFNIKRENFRWLGQSSGSSIESTVKCSSENSWSCSTRRIVESKTTFFLHFFVELKTSVFFFSHRTNGSNAIATRLQPHRFANRFDGSRVKTISIVMLDHRYYRKIFRHIGNREKNRRATFRVDRLRPRRWSLLMNECILYENLFKPNWSTVDVYRRHNWIV